MSKETKCIIVCDACRKRLIEDPTYSLRDAKTTDTDAFMCLFCLNDCYTIRNKDLGYNMYRLYRDELVFIYRCEKPSKSWDKISSS